MSKDKEEDSIDEYDPHVHRYHPRATTNFETLVHLLKGALGTGILALPQAFFYAGYINGLIGTIVIGVIATYSLQLLVKSQYVLCKRYRVPVLPYGISFKLALQDGPPFLRCLTPLGLGFVEFLICAYQLGSCSIYIIFISSNMKQLITYWSGGLNWDIRIYMLMLWIPFLLLMSVRDLKRLAPYSLFANLIFFFGIGCIFYYIFKDMPSTDDRVTFGEIRKYPLFIGVVLFAIISIGAITSVENNMATPQDFGGYFGVFNQSMFIIVSLYAVFGFLGYIKYGSEIEGSITLNLPQEEILAQIIKGMFSVAVFFSYAIQGYPFISIIWGDHLSKKFENSRHKLLMEFVVRYALTTVTLIFAVAVPRLGLIISFFGAFCLSLLGFCVPALMEICVLYPDKLRFSIIVKDIFLIIFGFIGLATGTYISIRDIVVSFM